MATRSNTQKNETKIEVTYPEGAIKVLDKGFVRLVDVMGDDSSIVQAARVSYGRGTKAVHQDEGLIRYLLRHHHTTPFEMVEFKFHCRMPIFVARQWIRHRTANVNEVSARYSEMPDWFYSPELEDATKQSKSNRQGGSDESVADPQKVVDSFDQVNSDCYGLYSDLIEDGTRRELARAVLPVSLYTEWYWKIDLHNLMHFLRLRMDSHAQKEIRVFADAMAKIVQQQVPMTWKAFEDYSLNSIKFSGSELEVIKPLLKKMGPVAEESFPTKREYREFVDKIENLLNN